MAGRPVAIVLTVVRAEAEPPLNKRVTGPVGLAQVIVKVWPAVRLKAVLVK